jgi:hypothetical protein
MKEVISNNWSFMRVIRLLAGIAIIIQAIANKDTVFGVAGFLFTIMALFNTGCCGTGGCDTPVKKTTKSTEEISYEEVVK